MYTVEWPGKYELRRIEHFDVCRTYEARIQNCERSVTAEHPGWELLIPRSGSWSVHLSGYRHVIEPGRALIFNALEPHTEEYSHRATVRGDAVVLRAEWLDELTRELGINASALVFRDPLITIDRELEALLRQLFQFRSFVDVSRVPFDCVTSGIVIWFLLRQRHSCSEKISKAISKDYGLSSFRAKKVIRDHAVDGALDLEGIARRCGLSRFHFLRSFKESVGVTPMRYMNGFRMDLAKIRLRKSKKSVIEIAFGLGYRDLSTFNKSFRRWTGSSPSEFRKQSRK